MPTKKKPVARKKTNYKSARSKAGVVRRRVDVKLVKLTILVIVAVVTVAAIASTRAATFETPNQWKKYYDAAGPTPGIYLKPSGGVSVTTDGAVVENLEITGGIYVNANNVTIRNVRILGTARDGILQVRGKSGMKIDRVEIIGQYKSGDVIDAYDQAVLGEEGFQLRNSRISGYPDGAKLHKNTVIEGNYFFNNSRTIDSKGRMKHVDGLQTMGGTNVIIRNNTFVSDGAAGMGSNLMLQNDFSAVSNYLIEGNRFSGGNYTIYLNGLKNTRGVFEQHKKFVIKDNLFAGKAPKGTAQYGPFYWKGDQMDVAMSNNYFIDNDGTTSKLADREGSTPITETPTPSDPVVTPPDEPEIEPVTPPTLTLKGLSNGQTVSGSISLEAVPANAPNVVGVDFYFDEQLVNTQKTPPICLFDDNGKICTPYNISNVTNGNHIVRAVLKYGTNQTLEQRITVNVQNPTPVDPGTVPPVVDTIAPSAPSALTRALSLDAVRFRYNLKLDWKASSDNVGVARYVVTRNGNQIGTTDKLSFTDTSISANVLYNYTIAAQDAAGNTSAVATTTAKGRCFLWFCGLE